MTVVKMKAARTNTLMNAHEAYEAFWEGFIDHQHGQHQNPFADLNNRVEAAQAWDSGHEAARRATAMRCD
jgi:hypothetical protein